MPSRAVLRKKARREAKKVKATTLTLKEVKSVVECDIPPAGCSPSSSPNPRKRARPSDYDDVTSETLVDAPALTRKERRRRETAERLERQMRRLEAARHDDGDREDRDAAGGESCPGPNETPRKERHDPRFQNGTFWKDRKEKRARTVFLGGIPVKQYNREDVENFIMSTLRKDSASAAYLREVELEKGGVSPIETVDFLPLKRDAKVRNMYIRLASVGLAGCLAACLNGFSLQGKKLRCNFASDKAQREEAIRRRGGNNH